MLKKPTIFIATLTFLVLTIFSLVFYKERMLFLDSSFHLFEILRTGTWAIQHSRISAFFTQLFPIVGAKIGCSISTIVIGYSVSFLVLYFGVFLLISVLLRNARIGIALLLYIILFTTHTFYWTLSEMSQGIAFMFLFFALLDNACKQNRIPVYFYVLSLTLLPLVAMAHPLLFFGFSFCVLFFGVTFPQRKKLIAIASLPYFVIYVAKNLIFRSGYDNGSMSGLRNFVALFPNYFSIPANKNLVRYIVNDYYLLPILLLLVVVVYVLQKRYWKLLLVLLFVIGYTLLINVTYFYGAPQFYIESQYLPLAIFIGLPFAYDVLPKISSEKLQAAVVGVIAVLGVIRIYNTHFFYAKRLNWYRDVLATTEKLPDKKIIYPSAFSPMKTVVMTWASSYEFWLLSTLETNESRSIIIEDREKEFEEKMNQNRHFIGRWKIIPYDRLPPRYFKLNDTSCYVRKEMPSGE